MTLEFGAKIVHLFVIQAVSEKYPAIWRGVAWVCCVEWERKEDMSWDISSWVIVGCVGLGLWEEDFVGFVVEAEEVECVSFGLEGDCG